jgi:DNA-binding CsgD family transcriptional regulator/tetratricopeptide (TPR) repeat protein
LEVLGRGGGARRGQCRRAVAAQWWFDAIAIAVTAGDPAGLAALQPGVGGLAPPFFDALLGQHLAQPGVLVVHVSSLPAAQPLSRDQSKPVVAGWLRIGAKASDPNPASAIRRRLPVPPLWPPPLYGAISLWPVTRDNRGEMGGRVASPTFVGRVEELHALEVARRRAADGEPAVVLVGGEAGVGKTRLLAELAGSWLNAGTRVLTGGCVPVGEGALPYAPIVEALRPLAAELGADAVRELAGPSWLELARLVPGLGEPPGGRPGPAAQTRLFELLLGLLGRLGERSPVALVVEDLHWADRSTRDLLAFLVRNLRRERLLVVVSYRSDEPGTDWLGPYLAVLDRSGRAQRLELSRLDRAETQAQLVGILGAAPPAELVDAVFGRSEGNPYFTEELLGAIRADSGELPATLRDLLRGRVQALPERARQVLGVVAVAGRRVPHRLLAAVAGLEDQPLVQALRAAVADQLLVTQPGEDGYELRHALLGEVIEADLLPGERVRLHGAYARALTNQPELADAAPAVATAALAVHWDAAGEWAQALPARVRAGLAAERGRAFAEADHHYQRALTLWGRVPEPGQPAGLDRVGLLARAVETAAFVGAPERAIGLVEQALDGVDRTVEPVRAAVLLAQLGFDRVLAGREADALAAFEEAERLLVGAAPSAAGARVLAGHARTLSLTRHTTQAVSRCEEAIAVARAVGARAEEAHALSTLGVCLDELGQLDRAAVLHRQARRIAEEVGDAEGIVRTYTNLSHVLAQAGQSHDANDDAREGYQRAHQLGLERATGSYVAGNLATGLLFTGQWEECGRLTAALLEVDSWSRFGIHTTRGLLLTRQGEFPAARREFDQAERLSPPAQQWSVWVGRAQLALWEGRHDQAGTAVAEGLRWMAERDPEGVPAQLLCLCYGAALRLEADQVEWAAARRTADGVAGARRRAAPVIAALDRLSDSPSPQARIPVVVCGLLLARAEQSRLEGRSDPERWRAAAAAWERLAYPFEATYARFRQAEALLAGGSHHRQAEAVLRPAHQTAVALGAGPLRREIELLAQRGRLRLEDQVDTASVPAAPSPVASLGLTSREAEVLALLAEGRTNRQIGQALFITPKTAGVHVSRILTKLGVAGRGEAAAVAHRLGLDKQ